MIGMLVRRRAMMMPKEDKLLTFTALQAGSTIAMSAVGNAPNVTLYYNKNDAGWLPFIVGTTTVTLDNIGDSVKFRGTNTGFASSNVDYNGFVITGEVAASGDITSILNETGGDAVLRRNAFDSLFYGCTGLVQAPALPATTLSNNCYIYMFYGCTGLVQAPALPATTLASYCYAAMFRGCSRLVRVPALPATTLAGGCYNSMFYDCTSITSYDMETLNDSSAVFQNNTSCASLTIHAATPPTIGSSTITGLKADCIIYVPSGSVAAYQDPSATYWYDRRDYIRAIQ